MGLSVSHGCYQGGYSGFHTFRKKLAREAGINLDDYRGFGGSLDLRDIDHGIVHLLDHSDCDGELSVDEAIRVATGLHDILLKFVPKEGNEDDADFVRMMTEFRNGCLDAIEREEEIEFR